MTQADKSFKLSPNVVLFLIVIIAASCLYLFLPKGNSLASTDQYRQTISRLDAGEAIPFKDMMWLGRGNDNHHLLILSEEKEVSIKDYRENLQGRLVVISRDKFETLNRDAEMYRRIFVDAKAPEGSDSK